MKLQLAKTIKEPGDLSNDRLPKVVALCWSSNNEKLAVATSDRYINIYDNRGTQREKKFSTKPADKNAVKSYQITDIRFSPDSTKLAIAQTDCVVFVYRLGDGWNQEKSICNKFIVSCPVTCMCWPHNRPDELVFGLANGKVEY